MLVFVEHAGGVFQGVPAERIAEFLGDANFLPGDLLDGHVQCVLGRIAVVADVRGSVDVMIRPEDLVLSNEAGQPAEVVSLDYYGHDQMLLLELADGRRVQARVGQRPVLERGDRVDLEFQEAVVFPTD